MADIPTYTHLGTTIFRDVDIDETMSTLWTVSKTLFSAEVINPNSSAVFLKAYNDDLVVGTDAPYWIWRIPAASTVVCITNAGYGATMAKLYMACVTTGGTAGTTGPTTAVTMTVQTS
jgi:hypothetical protein